MTDVDRILELTDRVEAEVENGDWLQASRLDAERQELLSELLANDGVRKLGDHARQLLRDVLARNQRTVHNVETQRYELGAASRRLADASQAVHRYRIVEGDAGPAKTEDAAEPFGR